MTKEYLKAVDSVLSGVSGFGAGLLNPLGSPSCRARLRSLIIVIRTFPMPARRS
jgi:hypothetical protein